MGGDGCVYVHAQGHALVQYARLNKQYFILFCTCLHTVLR